MKITGNNPPTREYPYLAIWTGAEPVKDWDSINLKDVVVIKLAKNDHGVKQAFVMGLFDDDVAYFTSKESDYIPLPAGYQLILEQ